MESIFSQIAGNLDVVFSMLLNRALAGTLLLLAACVYRLVFPKAPKWSRLTLWALAGIRLALPVSIKSVWSLVPSEQILDYRTAQYAAKPQITSGIAALNRAVNPAFGESFAANPAGSINPLQSAMFIAGLIWAAGLLIMLALALVRFSRLRKRVRVSIELEKGVRICDGIETPFLLGLFRPVIYLPSDLEQGEQDCILAHERSHLRHGDCLWKLLGYGILCAYWFYVPVWLAYGLFCRDLELACDERVVKGYSLEEKKRYASVLLANSLPRGAISVCPLAFGEVGVKERVRRVLDKKPAKAVIALALIACIIIGVCFLTSQKDSVIYGLSSGTYVMDEAGAVQILPSRVTFRMSGGRHEFVFMLSPVSSYYMAGDFTINDGFVTCSNGLYTLAFQIKDNDTIVLQIPDQDGLHMSGLFVPNGTEFHYEEPESRLGAEAPGAASSGEEIDLSDGRLVRAALFPEADAQQLLAAHLVTNSKEISVFCDTLPENAEVLLALYDASTNKQVLAAAALTSDEPSATFRPLTSAKQYALYAACRNCPEEVSVSITD